MKNFKIIFLMASIASAVILTLAGVVTFAIGMTMLDWDFRRLDPDYGAGFVQRIHHTAEELVEENISAVNIISDTGRGRDLIVTTRAANDFALYESDVEHFTSTSSIEDGVLNITVKTDGWSGVDGFWFRGMMTLRTRIYIPEGVTLNIGDASRIRFNGSVRVEDLDVETIGIHINSGSVRLNNVTVADDVNIRNDSGMVRINGLTADGNISLNNNSGEIRVNNVTSTYGDITITGRSGIIRADGITARDITATNTSGSIRLESVTLTGNLTFNNGSGTVRVSINGRLNDFDIDVQVRSGTGDMSIPNANADQRIYGRVSSGSSRVTFLG